MSAIRLHAQIRPAADLLAFAAQVGQHGEHAPVIGGCACDVQLADNVLHVLSTASAVITSASAMPRLDRPSAIKPSTSRSRGERLDSVDALTAELSRYDLGIQSGTACRDAVHDVDERIDVRDAVLEQVPTPAASSPTRSTAARSITYCDKTTTAMPWNRSRISRAARSPSRDAAAMTRAARTAPLRDG